MSAYTRYYKALLHLYPVHHRQEYEAEMVQLFEELLADTTSPRQRLSLVISTTAETIQWAMPEVTAQAGTNMTATPRFIKTNTIFSVLCIVPFLLASLYHLHTLYDHEAKPALLSLLIHTQILYAVVLPALGLMIAISTIIWSLVNSQRYWQVSWLVRLQAAWHNSLLVFGCIGLLAVAILS